MIAKEGYDPIYGARPLKRLIQKKLQDALAMMVLKGEIKKAIQLPWMLMQKEK